MTNGPKRTHKVLEALELVVEELSGNEKLRSAVQTEIQKGESRDKILDLANFLKASFQNSAV